MKTEILIVLIILIIVTKAEERREIRTERKWKEVREKERKVIKEEEEKDYRMTFYWEKNKIIKDRNYFKRFKEEIPAIKREERRRIREEECSENFIIGKGEIEECENGRCTVKGFSTQVGKKFDEEKYCYTFSKGIEESRRKEERKEIRIKIRQYKIIPKGTHYMTGSIISSPRARAGCAILPTHRCTKEFSGDIINSVPPTGYGYDIRDRFEIPRIGCTDVFGARTAMCTLVNFQPIKNYQVLKVNRMEEKMFIDIELKNNITRTIEWNGIGTREIDIDGDISVTFDNIIAEDVDNVKGNCVVKSVEGNQLKYITNCANHGETTDLNKFGAITQIIGNNAKFSIEEIAERIKYVNPIAGAETVEIIYDGVSQGRTYASARTIEQETGAEWDIEGLDVGDAEERINGIVKHKPTYGSIIEVMPVWNYIFVVNGGVFLTGTFKILNFQFYDGRIFGNYVTPTECLGQVYINIPGLAIAGGNLIYAQVCIFNPLDGTNATETDYLAAWSFNVTGIASGTTYQTNCVTIIQQANQVNAQVTGGIWYSFLCINTTAEIDYNSMLSSQRVNTLTEELKLSTTGTGRGRFFIKIKGKFRNVRTDENPACPRMDDSIAEIIEEEGKGPHLKLKIWSECGIGTVDISANNTLVMEPGLQRITKIQDIYKRQLKGRGLEHIWFHIILTSKNGEKIISKTFRLDKIETINPNNPNWFQKLWNDFYNWIIDWINYFSSWFMIAKSIKEKEDGGFIAYIKTLFNITIVLIVAPLVFIMIGAIIYLIMWIIGKILKLILFVELGKTITWIGCKIYDGSYVLLWIYVVIYKIMMLVVCEIIKKIKELVYTDQMKTKHAVDKNTEKIKEVKEMLEKLQQNRLKEE